MGLQGDCSIPLRPFLSYFHLQGGPLKNIFYSPQVFYEMFDGLSLEGEDDTWCVGLNFWPLKMCQDNIVSIFGDEDIMKDWLALTLHRTTLPLIFYWWDVIPPCSLLTRLDDTERKGLDRKCSAAYPGWIPFGCESEYAYFYVNCDRNSHYYGRIKYILNNSPQEHCLANSMVGFMSEVQRYLEDNIYEKDGRTILVHFIQWFNQRRATKQRKTETSTNLQDCEL